MNQNVCADKDATAIELPHVDPPAMRAERKLVIALTTVGLQDEAQEEQRFLDELSKRSSFPDSTVTQETGTP